MKLDSRRGSIQMLNPAEYRIAAIDQGSTSTKGAVYTPDGRCLARSRRPVQRRADGPRIEHDPLDIVAGVKAVLAELAQQTQPTALGLTCQRSTCLLWERKSGQPLTPALSWQDRRQVGAVNRLAQHAAEVSRRTGLRLSPYFAGPKLAGLLEDVPNGRARAEAGEVVAGTLDAFLVRQLTGRDATEPGHAGRTLLWSLERGVWDPELCGLFGVPRAALPEIRPSIGEWGEYRDTPLLAVLGDQQAALMGHGGWAEGVTAAHFGTGAFVLASTGPRLVTRQGLLSAVLADLGSRRHFQLEGSVNSAGSALDWACRLTGELPEAMQSVELVPEALPWVLPAFAGAAAPWWREEATGVIAGLALDTTAQDLVGGVLLGVGMRILDCVRALEEAGISSTVLRVSGRMTRLEGLVGVLADVGESTVEISQEEEAGLLGTVRAVAAAVGDTSLLLRAPPILSRREPRWSSDRATRIRESWQHFVEAAMRLGIDPQPGQN